MASSIRSRKRSLDNEENVGMIQAERGEASMSMEDVDQSAVGKQNATQVTAADMAVSSSPRKKHQLGIVEQATYLTCIILITTATLAIVGTSSVFVNLSMSLGIFSSVNVIMQRYQLSGMDRLRQVINGIRKEVNKLSVINEELIITIDSVDTEAQRLSSIKEELKETLAEQNEDMEHFMSIMRENRDIQKRMTQCLRNEVAQEIIEQVVKGDENKNFQIDPEEIDMLVLRLGTLEGLKIDEERFRKKMELRGYGLSSVLIVIKNLLVHDADDDTDGVFKLDMKAYRKSYTKELNIEMIQTN